MTAGSLKKMQFDKQEARRAEADVFKLRIPEEEAEEEESGSGAKGEEPKKMRVTEPVCLREVDPEVETDVIKSVVALQSVFNRSSTYMIVLFALFAISICSVVVPWRFVGQMVNLGPTSNHAAYRRCLVKASAHLTRELVLNDGFSRMTQGEIAGTLNGILTQLRQSDQAVRRGNLLRIQGGADQRSKEHNAVMYGQGCPWNEDGNCSTPDYPTSGTAGVFALSLMFMESVETVLETYGGPEDKWVDTFGVPRDVAEANSVESAITYDGSRNALLASDKSVHFVLEGFAGDLFTGYGLVLNVLKDEMTVLLDSVHSELRLLFGVYSSLLLFGFFFLLFRRTITASYEHTERARDFVQVSLLLSLSLSLPLSLFLSPSLFLSLPLSLFLSLTHSLYLSLLHTPNAPATLFRPTLNPEA
ncbi:hypothetical protein T484DRAFT_2659135 [Baffinella frigidus]|nr:hypothetical protein T484DRAFT_2659135 [Cryptophyta sp. CCMP2293]